MNTPKSLRKLLVATDFSPAAERATEHAAILARQHGAALLLVHAPAFAEQQGGQPELDQAVERLRALGLEASGSCRPGSPARAILEEADQSKADLIVVGTHGLSGWQRFLLGSTTRRVIEHAACPVLAIHEGDAVRPPGPRVVVFASDFSEASRKAALRATEILPLAPDDTAVLCHAAYLSPSVVPAVAPFSVPEFEQLVYEGTLDRLKEEGQVLKASGVPCRTEMIEGYPADALAAHAQELGAAMIVAGSVGRTGLPHLLIGSTAERIASRAHCPVLVVPPGRGPTPAAGLLHRFD